MEKRYQIIVSSTYQDLTEERQEVMQALLEQDCIPAGMELFPAANDDQWTLIKRIIDDCDYYMIIVAGRYGTVGPDGISFTEMEYRYALEKGKPIIGFLHESPETLPANRVEATPVGREKLHLFRELVKKKMCRFWDSPADLGSKVSRSLMKLIKANPAVGWIRADQLPSQDTLQEILCLRTRVDELEAMIASAATEAPSGAEDLARGEQTVRLKYTFRAREKAQPTYIDGKGYRNDFEISWNEIFANLSPLMMAEASETKLHSALDALVSRRENPALYKQNDLKQMVLHKFKVSDDDFHTVIIQLRALGLITRSVRNRSVKDTGTYWALTPFGDMSMTQLRALKSGETYRVTPGEGDDN